MARMSSRRLPRLAALARLLAGAACLVLFPALLQAQAPAGSPPALPPELEKVRSALEKYQDAVVAIHDGYHSTLGCVEYAEGGMGIHFLNLRLIGPVPDPMRPRILSYEPVGNQVRLVGAEWFIPLATGVKERPHLFGQPFEGPMEGHEPLQPAGLHHYDLHVWLFKPNPAGMFSHVNPAVKCKDVGYSFMLQPPKSVPHR